jgi:hypothetical protein
MKLKLKGRRFDNNEEIQAESQRVLDTVTEKGFQQAFQKWRKRWDRCLRGEETASRPYGKFYDFYSVGPEYFEHTLVLLNLHAHTFA